MESSERQSILDRPLVDLLKPDWEKAVYLLILILAVVSRFWDLGARAMSHDESLHALYSYYLYDGTGYQHNPMMHGPFLFHSNALIYFLFGDNDYTARIVPALFGVFMVLSPLLLRRWLGRMGTLVTSVLLLISPLFLYYSRYIRNDIYIAVWSMLMIAALFHLVRSRKPSWFYLGATALMFSLATKEIAYIFGFICLVFLIEVVLWERLSPRNRLWLNVVGGVLSVGLLVGGFFLARPPAEGAVVAEATRKALKLVGALVTVMGGTIPVMLVTGPLIPSRHPERSSIEETIRALPRRAWLVALVVMLLIYTLLFTTFFTNPAGLGSGIYGSINYWLAQQEVQRGGQPWYYYFVLLPMYEFLPLLFGVVAIGYYLVRRRKPAMEPRPAETTADREDEGGPSAGPSPAVESREHTLFVPFLIFWAITTIFIYSWAGEKMPWLGVHPAQPLIILSGLLLGRLLERVRWREVWHRGGALLALLVPVTLFGLYTLLRVQPFQGLSFFKLRETGNWLAAFVVTLLLLYLVWRVVRRLGVRKALAVGVVSVAGLMALFTVRFAWMASFVKYDYATELLVYAHGAADVVPTMNEVAEISRRTVGDKMIEVAYDNEVTWPLEWYLREYPNRRYYGETPTREKLNVPVVLSSERHDDRARPFLGDHYYRFKRRLVWWPNQQYMDLNWTRIREILGTPEQRKILWNILYWREYPRTPDNWYHVHNFYLYIRKDVAQQLWDLGAMPADAIELPPDPYLEAFVEQKSERVWGTVGTGPGEFNRPRGVAVGPDGNIYVVDSDNLRVQVFTPDGTLLRQWGSQCQLDTGLGCIDPDGNGPLAAGDGQFREPWGIAVDGNGFVYIADTWNHRIQVFDASGAFVTKWGIYGQTTGGGVLFYGPRALAVDASGRVFVTDTGNKRVAVFDQNGFLLDELGGDGSGPGQFREPVGIALDAEGNIYVADTWNGRIQVFGPDLTYQREWSVDAWYGESVVNKPFLAVDGQGRVYVTDPEGYQVIVFSREGTLLATFGQYGVEPGSFSLPTGIAVDTDGYVYVTDSDGQRVVKFEPLK